MTNAYLIQLVFKYVYNIFVNLAKLKNKTLTYKSKLKAVTVPWAWQAFSIKHCLQTTINIYKAWNPAGTCEFPCYSSYIIPLTQNRWKMLFGKQTSAKRVLNKHRHSACHTAFGILLPHHWSYSLAETVSNLLREKLGMFSTPVSSFSPGFHLRLLSSSATSSS